QVRQAAALLLSHQPAYPLMVLELLKRRMASTLASAMEPLPLLSVGPVVLSRVRPRIDSKLVMPSAPSHSGKRHWQTIRVMPSPSFTWKISVFWMLIILLALPTSPLL